MERVSSQLYLDGTFREEGDSDISDEGQAKEGKEEISIAGGFRITLKGQPYGRKCIG